jgi:hypothetical protein
VESRGDGYRQKLKISFYLSPVLSDWNKARYFDCEDGLPRLFHFFFMIFSGVFV